MADYSVQKVPDLKKILQDRGLAVSGNKADLVARLQEDDKKTGGTAGGAEDEIDWDDDEKAAESAPAPSAPVETPAEAPPAAKPVSDEVAKADTATTKEAEQETTTNPATTEKETSAAPDATATSESTEKKESEVPKQDFTAGVEATDAEKEAERRVARAKKFGLVVEDDESKRLAERAKKFGADVKDTVVKGLDSALPERRQKRGREDKKQGGRDAKRQTPDRRTEPRQQAKPRSAAPPQKKPAGRILDDPEEKAKAEARAKKFGAPAS